MIYVSTDFRPLEDGEKELLLSLLPGKEKMRILTLKNGFLESLIAYALLFYKTKGKTLARDSFGKPYFTDLENVHFSISHTHGAIAVSISPLPIGVDIEKNDRILSDAVLKRICSQQEFSLYKEKSPQDRITLWTLKEAYGKYKGKGISLPLSSVSFPSLSPLFCSDQSVHTDFVMESGFIVSYAASSKENFTFLSLQEFLDELKS